MNRVATIEPSARAELFSETAARLSVADAIVEKDFWVCWARYDAARPGSLRVVPPENRLNALEEHYKRFVLYVRNAATC